MEISKVEIIDGECYVGMNMLENELKKNKILEYENTNLKQALIDIREMCVIPRADNYPISTIIGDVIEKVDKVLGDEK